MPWSRQSGRSAPLPKNWKQLRARTLQRDGYRCTWTDDTGRCPNRATDVDHIVGAADGGTDDPTNLASLCPMHHRHKTGRDATAHRTPPPAARRPDDRRPGQP